MSTPAGPLGIVDRKSEAKADNEMLHRNREPLVFPESTLLDVSR